MDHSSHARRLAARLAAELAPAATGIALLGSVANGTDHPDSDIDLVIAAHGPERVDVRQVEGRMVTLTRKSPEALAAALTHPWEAGAAAGAWRYAVVLHDPEGRMAALQAAATSWTWDAIGAEADRWAAAELVGLAEEVHKVCGMLALGRSRGAAANRLILALHLAAPLGAAHRIIVDSENDLWDALADAEGPAWARAWDAAAGVTGEGHEAGCRGALALYRIAADRLARHLDTEARAVVDTACDRAART
ncbi:nucleotidyltransferase domain-containing protein [Glycomyces harbinensis]|uniref:Nucleotidyltransferase domain-containing protein n=1 Tax=Glycomyces harbinensis TaxID=58114 RepID=A0A1G6RBR9_9ACTN|nr:nucleotidyltransferase domain-containing protein [Glycomyces harbinensis]SDD01853.1 Nucleotidyltransferase domain-containing protein [Glycomyces harbinensis]